MSKECGLWLLSPTFVAADQRADGRNLDEEIYDIINTKSVRPFAKTNLPRIIYLGLTNTSRKLLLRCSNPTIIDGRCYFETVERVYETCPPEATGSRHVVCMPEIGYVVLSDEEWQPKLHLMLQLCHEQELNREEAIQRKANRMIINYDSAERRLQQVAASANMTLQEISLASSKSMVERFQRELLLSKSRIFTDEMINKVARSVIIRK